MINVVHDLLGACFAVNNIEVGTDPGDEVVLEGPFDDLVQQIGREELVDVGAREVVCEGLTQSQYHLKIRAEAAYHDVRNNAKRCPEQISVERGSRDVCRCAGTRNSTRAIEVVRRSCTPERTESDRICDAESPYALRTPSLHDASEKRLLGIVCDERPHAKDRATVMPVGA